MLPLLTFFRYSLRTALIALLTALVLAWPGPVDAQDSDLRPFSSDGCSLFPNGTPEDRTQWCDCCLSHDIAYWQGGTRQERKKADKALRECVRERTNDQGLAQTIYLGVRAGGFPVFPTWYRWGYGWPYGRGYKPLSAAERRLVGELLDKYKHEHPTGYCGEHSLKKKVD